MDRLNWVLKVLKWLYGHYGVYHPRLSAAVVGLIGGLLFAAIWMAIGRYYTASNPWKRYSITVVRGADPGSDTLHRSWWDLSFVSSGEGWLVGARTVGGGNGIDLGIGEMLRTMDRGASWSIVPKERFDSGKGEFYFGNNKNSWEEIGPINRIVSYPRHWGGDHFAEVWLAARTGIYSGEAKYPSDSNVIDPKQLVWQRSTPEPQNGGWAFFNDLIQNNAFSEVYAVGWLGIVHWTKEMGWEVQMETKSFPINAVFLFGDDVWAVGRDGPDGHHEAAIYHLKAPFKAPSRVWQKEPLHTLDLPELEFYDVLQIDWNTILAIGQSGLIVRGSRRADGLWGWRRIKSYKSESFRSIARDKGALWIVGDGGTILRSDNDGADWVWCPLEQVGDRQLENLNRVTFTNDTGWIVGDDVVLQLKSDGPD